MVHVAQRRWSDPWSWIALPGLVFIVVGFGAALLFTVYRSLTDPGPENYSQLLEWHSLVVLLNTFQASAIVVVVTLVGGYAYAYAMRIGPMALKIYLMLFLAVQFATSSIARAFAWIQLLQTNGVINKLLIASHVIDQPLKLWPAPLG